MNEEDAIDEALIESFPASDPPPWTLGVRHARSAPDGLVTIRSALPVAATVDKLVALITSRSMTVFARVDHAENARAVNMELRPTVLVIFGNPRAGTLLMQDLQTIGIDLPIHALVWQDATGAVSVAFDDVAWLAQRHGLGEHSADAVRTITRGLADLQRALSG